MNSTLGSMTKFVALVACIGVISSCASSPGMSSVATSPRKAPIQTAENSNNFGQPNYKITEKERAILALPQPLRDPGFEPPAVTAQGTRIIENPLESENLASHSDLRKSKKVTLPERFPHHQKKGYSVQAACSSHSWYGTQIKRFPTYAAPFAIAARHTVNRYQTLPWNGGATTDAIYAPTLLGPNDCSLEALTAYVRNPLSSSSGVYFGVYDHKMGLSPFSFQVWMDATTSTFASHYLDTNNQYLVDIEHFSNGYTSVYLYDNVYHAWAQMFTEQYGQAGYNSNNGVNRYEGWEMFEVWYDNYDPGAISEIKMNNLQMNRGDGFGTVWASQSAVGLVPANSYITDNSENGQFNPIQNWYTHSFYSSSPYLTDWKVSNP